MKKKLLVILIAILCITVYSILGVLACTEFFSGSWPSANPLHVHVDSSASAFTQAINPFCWNYKTSKVFFPSVHVGGTTCSSCKVFIKYGFLPYENVIAITQNYTSKTKIDSWMSGSWVKSVISINSRQVMLSPTTSFEFGSASNFLRQLVIVHELGHTLGLKHQILYCPESSIMWRNPINSSFNTPRPHDANTLVTKYGP
jgi:hypothetical protein